MNTHKSHKLQFSARQWNVLNILLVIGFASLFYKVLEFYSLKHTSALFIGIPTFMGIALALTPKIKHLTRNILVGISLGLVSSLIVLNEGSFCVPMTAPLFLGVGAIIGISCEQAKKNRLGKMQLILVTSIFCILSLEGVIHPLTASRSVTVSEEQIITVPSDEVKSRLAQKAQFTNLPFILKIGFPQPVWTKGEGLNIGDQRSVHFAGGEGKPGTATFEVTAQGDNWVRFELIKDSSHISHWLSWKISEVHWQAIDGQQTRVRWILSYDRQLDPVWYFGPLEKYATSLVAKALINNLIAD